MTLQLRKSSRMNSKIRLALTGPSGGGKTYSALLLARGLCGKWSDIAVLDTENGSADLYSALGDYQVITMNTPMSPEKYIQAIELCEEAGIKVMIIDSLSHCWEFLLDVHSNMAGNSFTNWGKITPRQNALIQRILSSNMHILATLRTKQDYVLNQKDGKYVPEKVGLKTIQREGVDYEFTLVFDIDIKHNAVVSKDRTNLFEGKPAFKITTQTGEEILQWCNSGDGDAFLERLNGCQSVKELIDMFRSNPQHQQQYKEQFTMRKAEILQESQLVNGEEVNNG
ncbi:MAG: AAA family ATPase [Bacteroidetes bacterium]|nr:AAA family ATPase [Bacteroidota bacterium]